MGEGVLCAYQAQSMAIPRKQKMAYSIHEKGTSLLSWSRPPSSAESSSEAAP